MFALVAAVLFAVALVLDVIDRSIGQLTPTTFLIAGLLFLALHLGPLRRR